MIKLIVTIDSLGGMSKNGKEPWQLPSVEKYQKRIASKGRVRAYESDFDDLWDENTALSQNAVVWARNGLEIQKELLDFVDELYITQIDGNFGCDLFFPPFGDEFFMAAKGKIKQENKILFQNQIWKSKRFYKSPEA